MIKIKEASKIMANLLRNGYTMLNLSCPVCNNPIFRDKSGEKFCPICNRKVLIIENYDEKRLSSKEVLESSKQDTQILENQLDDKMTNALKKIVIEKINLIALKLKDELQFEFIEKYTNLLLNLITLLKKFENVNNH
ncbi:MAG: Sjogren's syndrome/scleroderma autoantigen 1 family protein [Candidatus Hodarchaeota archaeon]